jgi:NADP-dependent aldehyde dehydrogenase
VSVVPSTAAEIAQTLDLAQDAATVWGAYAPARRAEVLEAIADALDAAADRLIPVAVAETNLTTDRLSGELKRTTFQLRIFGEVLREGGFFDARIDHADADWPMGAPRPDVRRTLIPLGPVAVFSASNFPFAFSVAGGDTASALAAGNPVIVKAHSGHPELSALTGEIAAEAIAGQGAPAGLLSVVYGTQAGVTVLQDPRIKAGAFTGSIPGGRALFDIAVSRPEPIPFYGELGSDNPVFVTKAAAGERAEEIVDGFIGSFTGSAGQLCTKPGMLIVPRESTIVELLRTKSYPPAAALLNGRIQDGYVAALTALQNHADVRVLHQDADAYADPPTPTLLHTDSAAVLADPATLQEECFGPASLIVEYDDESELVELAATFAGQLTSSIQGTDDDEVTELVAVLSRIAGRVLWNQWSTGLSVTYAQQHGGPYPATTAVTTTSVGTAAIERFLRPVAYQGFPDRLLPEQLREDNPLHVPRRVDGELSARG